MSCIDEVRKKFAGRKESDYHAIALELEKFRSDYFQGKDSLSQSDFKQKATEFLQDLKAESDRYRERVKRDSLKRVQMNAQWDRYPDIAAAVKAYSLGGTLDNVTGGNNSPVAFRHAMQDDLFDLAQTGLTKIEGHEKIISGDMDRELAIAMSAISTLQKPANVPQFVWEAAKVLNRVNAERRLRLIAEGVPVGHIENYIARQSYSPDKVRLESKEDFSSFIYDHLDVEATFPNMAKWDRLKALGDMWERVRTERFGSLEDNSDQPFKSVMGSTGNVEARAGRSRTLKYKDGEAFAAVNAKYGDGTIYESTMRGIQRDSRNASLVAFYGSDPVANLAKALQDREFKLSKIGDYAGAEKVKNAQAEARRALSTVLGEHTRLDPNDKFMPVGRVLKAGMTVSHLGMALISSLQDGMVTYFAARNVSDRGRLDIIRDITSTYFKSFKDVEIAKSEARRSGVYFGAYRDALMQDATAKAVDGMHRFNGMEFHDRASKAGASAFISNDLGQYANQPWEKVSDGWKKTFNRYAIGDKEWKFIAQAQDEKGFSLQALKLIPAQQFMNAGVQKNDVVSKFLQMSHDFGKMASSSPGPGMQHFMGDMHGPWGMIKSLSTQFLGSSVANTQNIRRLVKDRASVTVVGEFVAGAIGLGLVQNLLYDFAAKGEVPEELTGKDFGRAITRAGVAGVYGDYLARAISDRTSAVDFLGPVARDIGKVGITLKDAADLKNVGTEDWEADPKKLLKLIPQFTPNLFYTRFALDSLIMNRINQAADDKWLGRNQKRAQDNKRIQLLDPERTVGQ